MKKSYIQWEPKSNTRLMIKRADAILSSRKVPSSNVFQERVWTLRQLYFELGRVLKRECIPVPSYHQFVVNLRQARLAGMIDWDAITDPNAKCYSAKLYSLHGHNPEPEIWVADKGIAADFYSWCDWKGITLVSFNGYLDAKTIFQASERIEERMQAGYSTVILYLGDTTEAVQRIMEAAKKRLYMMVNNPVRALSVERFSLTEEDRKKWGIKGTELSEIHPDLLFEKVNAKINEITL